MDPAPSSFADRLRAALGTRPLRPFPALTTLLGGADTARAAGLAGAALANNAIQLLFTVVVTRILGAEGYGALAALISAFLILVVGGQSIQAAAARETALGRLGHGRELATVVRDWSRTLLVATAVLAVVGVLLRDPLSRLVGVPEHPWAAAGLPLTGGVWMFLCLERGILQGLHTLRPVASSLVLEAGSRLVIGVTLAAVAGVTGAFLATPLALAATAAWVWVALHARVHGAEATRGHHRTLRDLLAGGRVPVLALLLLAVLQNVDVIIARHALGHDAAGDYAVASVAAKAVVWVAIGVGLQLLPQATGRAAAGLDPVPVLLRALGVLGAIAAPAVLIFLAVPRLVLRVGFGPDTVGGADALPILGIAMTLLAVSYLAVQYLLALRHARFVAALAVVAAAEVAVLLTVDASIAGFAALVLAAQAAAAAAVVAVVLRTRPRARAITPRTHG